MRRSPVHGREFRTLARRVPPRRRRRVDRPRRRHRAARPPDFRRRRFGRISRRRRRLDGRAASRLRVGDGPGRRRRRPRRRGAPRLRYTTRRTQLSLTRSVTRTSRLRSAATQEDARYTGLSRFVCTPLVRCVRQYFSATSPAATSTRRASPSVAASRSSRPTTTRSSDCASRWRRLRRRPRTGVDDQCRRSCKSRETPRAGNCRRTKKSTSACGVLAATDRCIGRHFASKLTVTATSWSHFALVKAVFFALWSEAVV